MASKKSSSVKNMKIVNIMEFRERKLRDFYEEDAHDVEDLFMESMLQLALEFEEEKSSQSERLLKLLNRSVLEEGLSSDASKNEDNNCNDSDKLIKLLLMLMPGYDPDKEYSSEDIDSFLSNGEFPT
ncbi:MAG: hypothetical protein PF637_06190 [Spirochaetes bacterium]|jgi:hypothetical protein|nr:hypothetical protein [Spirochaetota bacterium]